MIGIFSVRHGLFMDLAENTRITYKIRHNIYDSGDPTFKRGSYTAPFNVPLTDRNKRILNNPHRSDIKGHLLIDEPVWLYISDNHGVGVPWKVGKIYIKSSSDSTAQISFIQEGLSDFAKKTFEDIDLPTIYKDSPNDMRDHAKETALNPQDHDYAFFPVKNEALIPSEVRLTDTIPGNYFKKHEIIQNAYYGCDNNAKFGLDNHNQSFGSGNKKIYRHEMVSPFVKVSVLMDKAFELLGMAVDNQWQTNDELKMLYVYNTFNSFERQWPSHIDLSKHVPRLKLNEGIKDICATFCVGIFPDLIKKKILLLPLKELLKRPHDADWTDKKLVGYKNSGDVNIPSDIKYEGSNIPDIDTTAFPSFKDFTPPFGSYPWLPYGKSFLEAFSAYVDQLDDVNSNIPLRTDRYTFFNNMYVGGAGETIELKAKPLPFDVSRAHFFVKLSHLDDYGCPYLSIDAQGSGTYYKYSLDGDPLDENGNIVSEFGEGHTMVTADNTIDSISLMFFRGMIQTVDNQGSTVSVPWASNNAYNPTVEDTTFEYSLHLDGEKGLFQKFWKEWIEFLRNKKTVTMPLLLNINDILNLKEYHKVRVGNQHYFIKELDVTIGPFGIEKTIGQLVSTL